MCELGKTFFVEFCEERALPSGVRGALYDCAARGTAAIHKTSSAFGYRMLSDALQNLGRLQKF